MKTEAQGRGVLTEILADTARRVEARAATLEEVTLRALRAAPAPSFAEAMRGDTVRVIGEVKRRSPSAGLIRDGAPAAKLALEYWHGGAAAISVLTEESRFGGSLDDLMLVSSSVNVPVLRKDFIIDPLQIFEARAAGAAAVLLIVRALGAARLQRLATLAHETGLATLVEVHSKEELDAAIAVRPTAIGVNSRDLETLAMHPGLHEELLPLVPDPVIAVAESGLKTRADVVRVARAGADAVLVGTAVAGAADASAAVRALTGVEKL